MLMPFQGTKFGGTFITTMKWYSPDMLVPVTPISVVSNFTCLGLKRKSKDSEKIGLAEQGHAMGSSGVGELGLHVRASGILFFY
jgi:hypothetical protein